MLSGDSSGGAAVLASPSGVPLDENAAHPAGANESLSFEVEGIDDVVGATVSDDTAATARQLGDVAGAGLIQVNGAIGVDPFFNPNLSPDPYSPPPQLTPANQVDVYHFEITEPGRYAMVAEVFAGRIGSPLQPGLSLYELDPSTGQLVFVDGNIGSLNPTEGTDGSVPLFSDPVLSDSLAAGDYYLAVAGAGNTPAPVQGQPFGSQGLFNPNQPGSAQNGWSTGPYVLNLCVLAMPAPQVIASSPSSGQVLDAAPTQLTVQFSEPMNITELAFQAFETSYQQALPQIYIEATDGAKYYPRFLAYNYDTNLATFQMLDALPNGSYGLHLAGWDGLTNIGGIPLYGNELNGDYVIPFEVDGPSRDITGNMTDGYMVDAVAGDGVPQDVGTLFPDELQAGVTIVRGPAAATSPAPAATGDEYTIQLMQSQFYSFALSGDDLPASTQVTLTNAMGETVPLLASWDGQTYFAPLTAGTYTVAVGGWTAGQSASVSYDLKIDLVGQQDNAPPLVTGPTPLIQILLDGAVGDTSSPAAAGPTAGSGTPGATTTGSSAGAGFVAVSLSVPSGLNSAPYDFAGALSNLAASPLGGAVGEAFATAGPAVQVALGPAPTPGYGGLVSLITSIYVLPADGVGEGIAPAGPAPALVADAGTASVPAPALAGHATPTVRVAGSPRHDAGQSIDTELAELPAPIPLAALAVSQPNLPGLLDRNVPPRAAATAVGVRGIGPVDRLLVTRLAITGATVAAALWGRRAVRELKCKKRVAAERPPSTRRSCRHQSHGSMTAVWSPGGNGPTLLRGGGRALERAEGARSQEAS